MKFFVCHHTGGVGFQGNVNLLSGDRKPGETNPKSVHFILGQKEGELARVENEKAILWHMGLCDDPKKPDIKIHGKYNAQKDCVGVEICSDGKVFTDWQRKAIKELFFYLRGINPNIELMRHKDFAAYRGKWDVGDNFWNNQFSTWGAYKQYMNDEWEKSKSVNKDRDLVINNMKTVFHNTAEKCREMAAKEANQTLQWIEIADLCSHAWLLSDKL